MAHAIDDYYDGAPCGSCGDEAHDALHVLGHDNPVPLCGSCMDHAVTLCGNCERRIWSHQGHRTFGTPTLYCVTCNEAVTQALNLQSVRDMDQVRR